MSSPPVTTKTGDGGYTDLIDEVGIPKYGLRVEVNGTLDEANSVLGVARATSQSRHVRESIFKIQSQLYVAMAEIAGGTHVIDAEAVADVEGLGQCLREGIKIPRGFITPGSTVVGAQIDVARSILRRAERRAALMHHTGQLSATMMKYLNRLGDVLFELARWEESQEGEDPDRPFGRVVSPQGVQ